MRGLRLALIALAACGLTNPAAAQSPTATSLQTVSRTCAQSCVSAFRACTVTEQGAANPAACDTAYVTCTIDCRSCTGRLSQCKTGDSTSAALSQPCLQEFATCRRESAKPSDSRPLITFSGGDGSTLEAAIVIKGAKNSLEGVVAESLWVGKRHPDWRKDSQALIDNGGKMFDRIEYVTAADERKTLFFDITDFFGKL